MAGMPLSAFTESRSGYASAAGACRVHSIALAKAWVEDEKLQFN